MARHINLTNKLSKEKPSITIGEHTFNINDEKSNILVMNQTLKDGSLSELEMMDKTLEILISKSGVKKLNSLNLSFKDYQTVFFAIMATINDEEIEDVEKRFRNQ